jgi:cardiolipin synthase
LLVVKTTPVSAVSLFHWEDPTVFGFAYAFVELLGILSALHAVMKSRTSQGAIAWVFALVLFPVISVPLYWVFGRNRFSGYLVARRAGETEIQKRVQAGLRGYRKRHGAVLVGDEARFGVLEKLARLPFSSGNAVELLLDGKTTFDAIFEAIDAAENYVLAQFFIIRDDELGREFQSRLIAAARRGIRVHLLYDEIGCRNRFRRLPMHYVRELVAAGVAVLPFRTKRRWVNWYQLNFRNHRKMVIVDGQTAFVGGTNVGDEYMGRSRRFGPWRDTQVQVRGPAVTCMQLAFAEDWYWSADRELTGMIWETERPAEPGYKTLVVPTGPADAVETCGLFFVHAINSARQRLWIASPYFVPDLHVQAALQLAAIRGVDVRVMLPDKADHLLVYLSGFSFIEEIDDSGVKFYRYQPGFLHQKVMLVDDDFAAVGTANVDNRSLRLNFEIIVAVADRKFAAEVAAMLERDFANSIPVIADELQERPLWFRFAVAASRLMAPVQ